MYNLLTPCTNWDDNVLPATLFGAGTGLIVGGVAGGVVGGLQFNNGLGTLNEPARELLLNEDVLITEAQGLQSNIKGSFNNTIIGTHGDNATKYLWTIDERGINIALESTPFPTPRGNIVHSNLSSKAYIGGEAWFTAENQVTINAGSGRFGDGAGITPRNWDAAIRFWRSLGYEVTAIPFGKR